MAWQFSSQQPIYQQIVACIAQGIISGKYPMGEKLPSVRDFALEASVNPNTMQRAMAELEIMGLITTQRNSGRSVTTEEDVIQKAKNQRAQVLVETFLDEMQSIGYSREDTMALLNKDCSKEGTGNDGRDS